MHAKISRRGFTLIELTIAITFLSILILAVIYVTIECGKLYAKGITYKSVNQVSREVVDTMRRDFATSTASMISTPPPLVVGGAGSLKMSGRVCTGQVSYAWNTAALLSGPGTKITANGANPIVFRRVVDVGGWFCRETSPGNYPMSIPSSMDSRELLSTNGRDLAAYVFTVDKLKDEGAGGQRGLYRITMQLGTNENGTTLYDPATGYGCRPPTDNTANFEYCTVIDFDAILRVGGRDL